MLLTRLTADDYIQLTTVQTSEKTWQLFNVNKQIRLHAGMVTWYNHSPWMPRLLYHYNYVSLANHVLVLRLIASLVSSYSTSCEQHKTNVSIKGAAKRCMRSLCLYCGRNGVLLDGELEVTEKSKLMCCASDVKSSMHFHLSTSVSNKLCLAFQVQVQPCIRRGGE